MKKLLLLITLINLSLSLTFSQPTRELRSVWLTSVYNIDWPHSTSVTAASQQSRLITILNSLQAANFNAVMFQVRPNADALYQSSYEPWSSWITGTRGQVPEYDPLAFLIQEANKRGMEVHAWLNPYRYEITSGQFAGRPGDYSQSHPELIIDYNGKTYFDPGNPATTQLIKNVVADLISRYDLDGVLFDDYFYPSNLPLSYDQETYDTYGTKEFVSQWYEVSGTLPSRGDFRRASVNNMVREVNDTIKAIHPSMVFGVSPAGIYSTQSSAATHWGTTLPSGISGNDNYNAINCDPLAWLSDQSVDYISPQLYWVIGGAQDFVTLTKWWGNEAKRHGRHHYPSLASYRLFSQKGDVYPDSSFIDVTKEAGHNLTKAGDNDKYNWPLSEIGNQLIANRANPNNLAQGIIFYNTRSTVNTQKDLAAYLATDLFSEKSIFPVLEWLPSLQEGGPQIAQIGVVGEMDGGTAAMDITGSSTDRFLLYGSDQLPVKETQQDAEFLQVVFGKDFAEFYHHDKQYFSIQEYMPNRELGFVSTPTAYQYLVPAVILSPVGETVCDDFIFRWELIPDSQQYQVLIASEQDPSNIIYRSPLISTNSLILPGGILAGQENYVFRVKSIAGQSVSWSAQGSFTTGQPEATQINAPSDGAQDVSLTVNLQWNSVAAINHYHLQIATDASFDEQSLVVDHQPVNMNLYTASLDQANQQYYARVKAINDCGSSLWSPVVSFTTAKGNLVDNVNLSVLKIYPNPVTDKCFISYPYPLGQRTIMIHDTQGRLIDQFVKSDRVLSEEIDLSSMAPGLYFLKIETNTGERFMSRLVKSN